jgi:hypothetical protein
MTLAACSGCRAPIRWVTTRSGKSMPCDPDVIHEWVTDATKTTSVRIILQDPDGDTHTGWQATAITPGAFEISGYVPHWATCPQRDAFRNRRAQ